MNVLPQARSALAWLLPGALLAVYLVVSDRLVIPMAPPGDGARVMKGTSSARTMRPARSTKLPIRPPNRPLDQRPVEVVSPLTGNRMRTTEQKLWMELVKNPEKGVLYYHLAQVHGLRKEPDRSVAMLRLAAKKGVSAFHFTQKAMLADQAMDSIRYDPIFVMYVRGLPDTEQ